MGYKNYNDKLYHHGVLGMKWGVRRYQNKDGSLIKGASDKYNDDRTVIKKGTTFNRISTVAENRARKGRTYLTYTDKDHDYYKENMTKYKRQMLGENTKMYDVSYNNVRDIVYPSHKKQVDEFVEMYNNKKIRSMLASQVSYENTSRYLESVYGVKFSKKDIENSDVYKVLKKEYSDYKDKDIVTQGYNQFIKTYSDIKVAQLYQKRLMKQGYNAIMDDNDIMNNTMDSIRPNNSLIVFSGNKNLKSIGAKELTNQEYDQALKNNKKRRRGENSK